MDIQTVATVVGILLAVLSTVWMIMQIRDRLQRNSNPDKPQITAEIHVPGNLFVVGPTADYQNVRLRLDLLVFLRNRQPVSTTVWFESLTITGKTLERDYGIESASLRKRGGASSTSGQSNVNIDGGGSTEAIAEIRLLIPNDDLERWGRDYDGELLLGETYGTKLPATRLKFILSSAPAPPVPAS